MNSLKKIIDLTVVANLDRRHDRLAHMEAQMRREGIEYHRESSCDGRSFLPIFGEFPERTDLAPDPVILNRSDGAHLCTFLKALMMAKFGHCRNMLWLEDDAVLPVGFSRRLRYQIERAPPWDVINLGPWNVGETIPIYDQWHRTTDTRNTHALVINESAYDRLIAHALAGCDTLEGILIKDRTISMLVRDGDHIGQMTGFSDRASRYYGHADGRVDITNVNDPADSPYIEGGHEGILVHRRNADAELWHLDCIFSANEYGLDDLPLVPERVMDIGAFGGGLARFIRKKFPNSSVVAVEPDKTNYNLLHENTHFDPNIIPFHAAAWYSESDRVTLTNMCSAATHETMAATVKEIGDTTLAPQRPTGMLFSQEEQVIAKTLEELLSSASWPTCDLLILSCNKSEVNILENLNKERFKMIVIEESNAEWFRSVCKSKFEGWTIRETYRTGECRKHLMINPEALES